MHSMSLVPGTVFAGYTVVDEVGSGGMGEVYRVEHPRLPRRDALKVLPAALTGDREFRERFAREGDLAAGLWHPHIVGVHDRGEFNGRLWIAMDLVEGSDAGRLLRDRYPAGMPAGEAVKILSAIAEALDYAHGRGLLHRDVKPANILLSDPASGQGRILLTDFGIARPIADPGGLTATNLTVGTVAYAAPEQLMGDGLDGRADQYALAATAYHLLAGTPVFQNSNPVAVISQHLSTPAPKISAVRPDLTGMDDALAKALAKSPADRYPSCEAFAAALRSGVAGTDYDATLIGSLNAVRATQGPIQARGGKRWRGASIAAAVVLVVAVGAGAFWMTRPEPVAEAPKVATLPAGVVLDGTYRLNFDFGQSTLQGSPNPAPNEKPERWWAFQTRCDEAACAAAGVQLDTDNHQAAHRDGARTTLRFIDGRWVADPQRDRNDEIEKCSVGADGTWQKGTDTSVSAWWMQPQSNGSFRGQWTGTTVSSECGFQGVVTEIPFAAVRTGDAPAALAFPDPAAAQATPIPPVVAGPVLSGAYRLDFDGDTVSSNGQIRGDSQDSVKWWAFRSVCTTSGCVATAAELDTANPAEASGTAAVLRLVDGRWTSTAADIRIACGSTPTPEVTMEQTRTFEPFPDGTLKGSERLTFTSSECGNQGMWIDYPFTATRIGDVPGRVIIADPALFAAT
ncbi:serine/threonine protein kinase [Mycolicibacterium rhodesiae JS60]|nr:serine/threonine protein kinase [Mycolicibacterium rhodesiae JS60]